MYNAKVYDALFLQTLLHLMQEKCSACRISNYLSLCFTVIGQWVSLGIALQILHSLKSQNFLSPFALSGLLRQPVLYSLPASSHHSTLFSFGFQFSPLVTSTPIACSFMLPEYYLQNRVSFGSLGCCPRSERSATEASSGGKLSLFLWLWRRLFR